MGEKGLELKSFPTLGQYSFFYSTTQLLTPALTIGSILLGTCALAPPSFLRILRLCLPPPSMAECPGSFETALECIPNLCYSIQNSISTASSRGSLQITCHQNPSQHGWSSAKTHLLPLMGLFNANDCLQQHHRLTPHAPSTGPALTT